MRVPRTLSWVLVALLSATVCPPLAADETLRAHWNEAMRLVQAQDPEGAFQEAKKAYARAQTLPELSFELRLEAASSYGFLALQVGKEIAEAAEALGLVVGAFESEGLTAQPRYTPTALLLARAFLGSDREGRADEVVARLEKNALSNDTMTDETRAAALAAVAAFVFERGRRLDAARLVERMLGLSVQIPEFQAVELVILFGNAAYKASEEQRTDDNVLLSGVSLSVAERYLRPEHPLLDGALWRVHNARIAAGDHEGAIAPLEKLLAAGDLDPGEKEYIAGMATTMSEYAHVASFKTRPDIQLGTARLAVAFARGLGDPLDPRLGRALRQLAWAYGGVGRDQESDAALQEAIEILEQSPEEGQTLALLIDDLAISAWEAERYGEAERLFHRADLLAQRLEGTELEVEAADRAIRLFNRAALFVDTGRLAEGLAQLSEAYGLMETERGRRELKWNDETLIAKILEKKAHAHSLNGETELALEASAEAIARAEEFYPETHVELALRWMNRADLLSGPDVPDEMIEALRRAIEIYEGTGIDDLPELGEARFRLGASLLARGDVRQGAQEVERAVEVFLSTANREHLKENAFQLLVKAWSDLAANDEPMIDDAFQTIQWTQQAASAEAVRAVGRRLAQRDPATAALLRRRQDATAGMARERAELVAALSQPEPEAAHLSAIRRRLSDHEKNAAEIAEQLHASGVDLVGLGETLPSSLSDVQGLLSADEVLVVFGLPSLNPRLILTEAGSSNFVIAMTRDTVDWGWVTESSGTRLRERAAELAAGGWESDGNTAEVGRGVAAAQSGSFDPRTAHDLYRILFGPVDALVASRPHLIVAPPRELIGVPFHALLTAYDEKGAPSPRQAQWLIRRQAVSVMPSIGSLVALRTAGSAGRSSSPFLGVGDPLVGDRSSIDCAIDLVSNRRSAAPDIDYFREAGGAGLAVADVEALRSLPALPDSRCELQSIAERLGAGDLLLGADATETSVKALSEENVLAAYDVVAFATHGLVAGEAGAREAALVLTPPAVASAEDDGLLAASEIATLRLNADLVVLSACNTAAGSDKGAEGLSGLARSFFYAGARTLLVSHWSVYSSAAVGLTTKMFDEWRAHPSISKAEALRRAMLAILDDPASTPVMLQPLYWAPFAIVGEARR